MSNETESRKGFEEAFPLPPHCKYSELHDCYEHAGWLAVEYTEKYKAWKARDTEVNKLREDVERLRNQLELSEEDIDCVHMWLDDCSIPRSKGDNTYSVVGRIQCLLEVKAAKETSK